MQHAGPGLPFHPGPGTSIPWVSCHTNTPQLHSPKGYVITHIHQGSRKGTSKARAQGGVTSLGQSPKTVALST